ncbi:hypothetical protein H6G17_20110 [Chroococcidiopsis sp. FACHB-1243]|uniref:hypothetical protein n=1 Tax=Chroococcidiopsis sp. [FACHB-1243] TaxID=2692781 RepID=UPI00177AA50A|nr:hypothetical protein [Chroococcidiopsis sp. [FACHB-1243]]MBD2307777.1 hypothetical protein [Chroococcidiopsis sp. [FACHB-1243]]
MSAPRCTRCLVARTTSGIGGTREKKPLCHKTLYFLSKTRSHYYCLLVCRRLYNIAIDALVERSLDDNAVAATVVNEGDKGGGIDKLELDAADL